MNSRHALLGALLLAAAAALYIFVIRDGKAAPAKNATTGDEVARPEREQPLPRVPGQARQPVPDGDPEGVGHDRQAPRPDRPEIFVREDGTEVRDHRKQKGNWVKPALGHPSTSPVTPEITALVMKQIRPVVLTCMQDVPDSAFGSKPVVMTRAQVSIDDAGMLTVNELGPAIDDIDEEAAAAALDCIRNKAGTLTTRVDHAAVASATLAFPIRPLDYRR